MLIARQRLLDQLDVALLEPLKIRKRLIERPARVGVNDQASIPARFSHGAHARFVIVTSQFNFDHRIIGDLLRHTGHRVRRIDADRETRR